MKIAQIHLKAQEFSILGPSKLINQLQLLISVGNKELLDEIYSEWGVLCCMTEDFIPLNKIEYWDVEKQIVYRDPYVIPKNQRLKM